MAIVPAAPPTRKNQRATSWPAPISATVPYQRGSRLIRRAFWWVSADCISWSTPVTAHLEAVDGAFAALSSERSLGPPRKV